MTARAEELRRRDLTQRLSEAEATIAALLSGQIDAVVDPNSHTPVLVAKAQEALRESEERYRHERDRAQRYLDTAEVMLLALDLEGRISLVNRYACGVLGRTADELLGRDWLEMCVPGRIRDAVGATFQNLLGGDLAVVENLVLTKSGEEKLIEWRNTVLRDDRGQVTGTFSSGTDITQRKRAADALQITEERMRFALEAAGVGIWDMDYTTGMVKWSETVESQYGLQPGTFGGTFQAYMDLVHPDDRRAVTDTVEKAVKAGADFTTQSRAILPDGTMRWMTNAGRIYLDGSGKPVRGVGISMDVTDRRTLEEQYQQAQKMEAMGRLAGGVAHDFNNLLTVILGFCEMLLEDGESDPRRADIAEIQKAGMYAAGLTRQLLAFSRKQIIQPTRLDLNVVVSDMRVILGRLIGEDVKILMYLQPDLAGVLADRGQVDQIVLNLAVNARDAMQGGGTLSIKTANVRLDEHYATTHLAVNAGPYVALTVSDTGTGMSKQVQARLFEPFFTTKEVGKGSGLGLATVHGIVTRSGGSVNVYSEVGKGTSFTVYFPRDDSAAAEADTPIAAPSAPSAHSRAATVLLVEDSGGLRTLTDRLLQRQGYTVLVAANAEEAVQLFGQNPSIDVLLTDVVMPGASGPELTTELMKQRPTLKVVYMSGYTEEAIVHHGVLDAGITFLHKPFTAEGLGLKIRQVLDQ